MSLFSLICPILNILIIHNCWKFNPVLILFDELVGETFFFSSHILLNNNFYRCFILLLNHLLFDCLYDVITTPTLLLHGMESCWIDARGDIVPYDEPPTEPRGVVKNDVEFVVSSSLSEYRLKITTKPHAFNENIM